MATRKTAAKAKAAAPKAKAAAPKAKAATKAKAAAPAVKAKAAKAKPAAKGKFMPRTKAQIMTAFAEAAELNKAQAKKAYEALLAIAYAGAKAESGIVLPGLGKLIKMKRPARMGRNPATGASIKIPAKTVVKFRIAKVCKDSVLG